MCEEVAETLLVVAVLGGLVHKPQNLIGKSVKCVSGSISGRLEGVCSVFMCAMLIVSV